ncbi:hypothetical protein BDR04DRAFT_1101057 [Suillus decipiens]|nr:hypothetical protein BDR04DRAFT_1101057 [Suillus decipiens]
MQPQLIGPLKDIVANLKYNQKLTIISKPFVVDADATAIDTAGLDEWTISGLTGNICMCAWHGSGSLTTLSHPNSSTNL